MASSSGPNTLLENLQHLPDEFQAAIIDGGRELIPVQLPDNPTRSPTPPTSFTKPSVSFESSEISEIIDLSPNAMVRKMQAGSPLQIFRHSRVTSEPPGSPRSDFSRNSEESVIIVGDTFSAPMNLQFSVDSSPHVRDAGAFDRYSHSTSHSMSNSLSWRRDDVSPSLTSTPPTNYRRPLPSTPGPPVLGSPFVPNQCTSPAVSSASSSVSRPKTSPTGPRPLGKPVELGDAGIKDSRWKKKKKKEEYLSSMRSGHEPVQSPPRFNAVGGGQARSQHQTSPRLAPDRKLNPLATSFRPAADSLKSRAHSLPGEPASEQMPSSSNFHRQHSAEAYPSYSLQSVDRSTAPSETYRIEQDIHHLRPWPSFSQMQSFAFPEHQHHPSLQPSSQQHPHLLALHQHHALLHTQQQQRQAYYQNQVNQFAMMNLRSGFGTMQVLPSSALSAPRHAQFGPNHSLPFSYGQVPQSWPMEGRASSLPHLHLGSSGSSESSTSTPHSAPVELPLDLLGHALTEIQIPETHITTSIRHNPAVERNVGVIKGPIDNSTLPVVDYKGQAPRLASQGNKGKQPGSAQSHGFKPTGSSSKPPRAPGSSLMARGKSNLTPVTERSEISTPNASASSASAPKEKAKKPKRRSKNSKGYPAAGAKGNHETPKKA